MFINVLIFQMETGAFGVLGHLVVPHVEEEPRPEQEFVTLLLPYMEVPIVLDLELKVRLVTMQHVLSVSITKASLIMKCYENVLLPRLT